MSEHGQADRGTTVLPSTPPRVEAARRAQSGTWTFGPEGTVELRTNVVLAEMVAAGLIAAFFVSAEQQIAGRDDYYRLTDAGDRWLAAAAPQALATPGPVLTTAEPDAVLRPAVPGRRESAP